MSAATSTLWFLPPTTRGWLISTVSASACGGCRTLAIAFLSTSQGCQARQCINLRRFHPIKLNCSSSNISIFSSSSLLTQQVMHQTHSVSTQGSSGAIWSACCTCSCRLWTYSRLASLMALQKPFGLMSWACCSWWKCKGWQRYV